jgi:ABC-type lipoprotein export system ATPase subunit
MNSDPPLSQPTPAPGPRPCLVEAIGVTKVFRLGQRSVEVLKGVQLGVRQGEFVALRGASGAGKSTLLHLLGGLDAPDDGRIEFDGLDVSALSARARARFRNREVGFVFQAYHLFPELDALENVCLPARMARVAPRVARARARALLERVGLAERAGHRPAELSGGEQQRVAIARALINEPRVILADEPTGNLDSRTGAEVLELLQQLQAERHATLIVATHDAHLAGRAQRIAELVDGQVA